MSTASWPSDSDAFHVAGEIDHAAGVADAPVTDYHEYIKANWKANVASGATEQDWFKILQDGVYNYAGEDAAAMAFAGNVNDAAAKIAARKQGGDEVVVYEKTGLGNGNQANNPWLQELPDPISKVCWDNYFAVSPKFAKDKGWKQGDVIEVKAGSASVKAPVCLQPGQADNTLAIAMGYGRTAAGTAAIGVGANAYPFLSMMDGAVVSYAVGATVNKTVEEYALASTQTRHTMMGRAIVKETTLDEYKHDPTAGNHIHMLATHKGKMKPSDVNLWATEELPGHEEA